MAAVKTFALGALAMVLVAWAGAARADSLSWQWTTWSPGSGVVPSDLSGTNQVIAADQAPVIPLPSSSTAPISGSWQVASPTAAAPAAPAPAPAAPAPGTVDAYVNLGSNPYPESTVLTTGGAQPWYNSPQITGLFGGVPNAQQRADFTSAVLQRVQQTFQQAGVPVTLTANPAVPAAHTLSVVSHTANGTDPGAIGMTDLGGNGFSFIDKSAPSAQNVDQLEWIVAHNVAHELMLAFGVPEVHDKTGGYIDATFANWGMMVNPGATFSRGAAQDLLSQNFLLNTDSARPLPQMIGPSPVPEPATLAIWALVGTAIAARHRARRHRRARA